MDNKCGSDDLLTFKVGDFNFGLNLCDIDAVIETDKIYLIPAIEDTEHEICGTVSFKNQAVAVADTAKIFKITTVATKEKIQRIAILAVGNRCLGLKLGSSVPTFFRSGESGESSSDDELFIKSSFHFSNKLIKIIDWRAIFDSSIQHLR
ncbi:MAG: chemotaxis protein CheW [Deltaproteobacteria bacterium]|nr:chemotaxis protein CheW [Deltaproteobacteria bacterium]